MFPALETTSKTIEDKIESKLLSSMKSEEEPETTDPEEKSEPIKKETKISKYHSNRLRKKIKEMVRRSFTDRKISKLIKK